jgi:hypothetical protein
LFEAGLFGIHGVYPLVDETKRHTSTTLWWGGSV